MTYTPTHNDNMWFCIHTYYIYIIYSNKHNQFPVGKKGDRRAASNVCIYSCRFIMLSSFVFHTQFFGRKFSLERTTLNESCKKKEGSISLLLFNECSKALWDNYLSLLQVVLWRLYTEWVNGWRFANLKLPYDRDGVL